VPSLRKVVLQHSDGILDASDKGGKPSREFESRLSASAFDPAQASVVSGVCAFDEGGLAKSRRSGAVLKR
jgi:hypothetical protein